MAFDKIPMTTEECFGTKDGLTYEKELTLLADRFGMTKEDTLKTVVHAVYITGVCHSVLHEVLKIGLHKLIDDEYIQSLKYSCDGTPIENDDIEEDEDVPF